MFTLNEMVYEVRGKVKGMEEQQFVTSVSSDTRSMVNGSVFVALRGDNFNGHDYCLEALAKGALAVVVEKDTGLPPDKVVKVKNTRTAFLQIGGLWRRKCAAKIVAITGSVGKTTTKEMTALVLESMGKTLKTRENLNNEIGLAQMLLELDNSYKFGVFELGVDGIGQMLPMAKAAAPDIGLVTNIGDSHLETFGTRRRIHREKLCLKNGMNHEGTLLLNGDDALLVSTKVRGVGSMFFGIKALSAEIQGREIEFGEDYTQFNLYYRNQNYPVRLPTLGFHNVSDALSAFGAGVLLGVPPQQAAKALEAYVPEGMRQKTVKLKNFTVIEDCYNASPQSMTAAISTLENMSVLGRKILFLGDMMELGKKEKESHYKLGEFLASRVDVLYATGPLSKEIVAGAKAKGMKDVYYFEDKIQLVENLKGALKPNDLVWVKASRSMKLEETLPILYQEA